MLFQRNLICVVICLKISTFVVSTTTLPKLSLPLYLLWFAWKYLPLWYQQQPTSPALIIASRCDLLENIYLCGINNNGIMQGNLLFAVVICLKISTFVVSTTTCFSSSFYCTMLWFAWKYLPLWYQQQPRWEIPSTTISCDLLENIYLCGINNNVEKEQRIRRLLWFAWKYLPLWYQQQQRGFVFYDISRCDLLENIYLCGINNNVLTFQVNDRAVVICLKISTFVVSTTTLSPLRWAARSCDLLENIYLCGINNNLASVWS